MKNERLLRALGEIDESYISEAAPKNNTFEMRKKEMKIKTLFKRPMTAAAALALCVCISGVTALAASGTLQGFFADVFAMNGAVVGTVYEQATEEISMEVNDELELEVVFETPDKAPYSEIEKLSIHSYQITDMNGTVITEGSSSEMNTVSDGRVTVSLSLDNIPEGSYKLLVSELSSCKNADPNLIIKGSWSCNFTK